MKVINGTRLRNAFECVLVFFFCFFLSSRKAGTENTKKNGDAGVGKSCAYANEMLMRGPIRSTHVPAAFDARWPVLLIIKGGVA